MTPVVLVDLMLLLFPQALIVVVLVDLVLLLFPQALIVVALVSLSFLSFDGNYVHLYMLSSGGGGWCAHAPAGRKFPGPACHCHLRGCLGQWQRLRRGGSGGRYVGVFKMSLTMLAWEVSQHVCTTMRAHS